MSVFGRMNGHKKEAVTEERMGGGRNTKGRVQNAYPTLLLILLP
jgi:hypothetical protein